MTEARDRWNDAAQVERFAARDADHRLVALLGGHPDPAGTRVLDLGCAGGRNADWLARAGFDVWALDQAEAMVARTRERVGAVLGAAEARRRAIQGTMTALDVLPVETFDLVVALGIYHQAATEEEWFAALSETARVVAPGGRVLVSNFLPGTVLDGVALPRVEGTRFVHRGRHDGTLCLREAADLDADFRALGLPPEVPTETVVREVETSRRVVANARYRREA